MNEPLATSITPLAIPKLRKFEQSNHYIALCFRKDKTHKKFTM